MGIIQVFSKIFRFKGAPCLEKPSLIQSPTVVVEGWCKTSVANRTEMDSFDSWPFISFICGELSLQALLNNPETLRSIMFSNPQMQQVRSSRNPYGPSIGLDFEYHLRFFQMFFMWFCEAFFPLRLGNVGFFFNPKML